MTCLWLLEPLGRYSRFVGHVVRPKDGPFGVSTISDIVLGNVPQNTPKRGVSRHFQAKLPKSKKRNISETMHPISPEFDDETHTSWVVHQSRT